ncbi:type II toxin-antitoxin system VapC family toxin [Balneolaceae bacterium ANBcel3]|nr:type II toxin-antitoxin system VapC family toxin [Balneolaceae bacterium ANBcel3]
MKPKVYIETSVISYLCGKPSRDLITAGRQQITLHWWEVQKSNFQLFVSEPIWDESELGDPQAVEKRLSVLRKIAQLEVTPEALEFAKFLVANTPFPDNAKVDALHISIATVQHMDYILTWNFKHIANASIRSKLEVLAQSRSINLPIICTPEELVYF